MKINLLETKLRMERFEEDEHERVFLLPDKKLTIAEALSRFERLDNAVRRRGELKKEKRNKGIGWCRR